MPVFQPAAELLVQLQTGKIRAILAITGEKWLEGMPGEMSAPTEKDAGPVDAPRVLFPGAFNPLHAGHLAMAQVAAKWTGCDVHFEISVSNVDKPDLDYAELDRRTGQFAAGQHIWLTMAPTFAEKSHIFPETTFVVGADTIERLVMPRYYGTGSAALCGLTRAIEQITHIGCRFLVFGRFYDGRFKSLDDVPLPPSLRTICQQVPETEYRYDVSSSSLRQLRELRDV